MPLLTKLAAELTKAELADRPWMAGGVLPKQDRAAVRELGFTGVFPTGASFDEIATFIEENAR